MSRTTAYQWSNSTPMTEVLEPYTLRLSTYALEKDNGNKAVLDNVSAPPQKEVVTFKGSDIATVDTVASVEYPVPTKGVQYSVRVDNVLKTTDSSDPTYVVEEPIVVQINIRHPKSEHFSENNAAKVHEAVMRAVSALYYEANAALQNRYVDLMRGQERPLVG